MAVQPAMALLDAGAVRAERQCRPHQVDAFDAWRFTLESTCCAKSWSELGELSATPRGGVQ